MAYKSKSIISLGNLLGNLLKRTFFVLLLLVVLGSIFNHRTAQALWPFSKSIVDAVRDGDSQTTEDLLKKGGIDINQKYKYGLSFDKGTLLHIAAQYGHADVIRVLIKYGALVNEESAEGNTPMYEAATWGKVSAVKELCKNNADITWALFYVAHGVRTHGGNHVECVSALIECGALVNRKNSMGMTAFDLVKEFHGVDTSIYTHLAREAEIADLLLKYGAIDEIRSKDGILKPIIVTAPNKYIFNVTSEEYFITVESDLFFKKSFPSSVTGYRFATYKGRTLERVSSTENRVISEHVIELIDKFGARLWVDNGLNHEISVIIDESVKDKIYIKPKTIQKVVVERGIRRITVIDRNGSKIKDEKIDLRPGASGYDYIYALGKNTYKLDHQTYK